MMFGLGSRVSTLALLSKALRSPSCRRHFNNNSNNNKSIARTMVTIRWIKRNGEVQETQGKIGENLMRLAQRNGIELEGACEGVCACSTCHVILEDATYNTLPDPTEAEDDMLDQAPGLKPTSRLGCQVVVDESMNGITVKVPAVTRNFYVDGHVPVPH